MAQVARALKALDDAGSHELGLVHAFPTVAQALGAERMYLFQISQANEFEFFCDEEAAGLLSDYAANNWAARDDWTQTCLSLRRIDTLLTDAAVMGPERRRRSPYFQEFAQKWRCGRVAAWAFHWAGERWGFTLSRDEAAGDFDAAECAAIKAVMANANRAAIAAAALHDARRFGFAEGFAAAGRAVILLDHTGAVSFVSAAAERLFGPGFGVRDGRLFSHDPLVQGEFDRLAARARQPKAWATQRATFQIPHGPPGLRPLQASASAVRLSALDALPGARLMLCLTALDARTAPSLDALQAAFRLTIREAQITQALARGDDLEAIAAQFEIAVQTVRHHLKGVLAKTGTSRQGELVALVKEMPAA